MQHKNNIQVNTPRVMFAATRSGSGKTTVTCGVLAALKKQNIKVQAYKCGPDYIDPMFHRTVLGIDRCSLCSKYNRNRRSRGSNIAAAICNALLYELRDMEK